MNITIKAVLWEHKEDKGGLCPVMIRLTLNRKITYHKTGIKITKNSWQNGVVAKPYPNYDLLNAKVNKIVSDLERELLKRDINGETISLKKAKDLLQPDNGGRTDFLVHAKKLIAEKNPAQEKSYNNEYNEIVRYAGSSILFADITTTFLNKYYKYLIKKKAHNSTINAFKFIKGVFNDARKIGITTLYPFGTLEFVYPKYHETNKDYLTMDECELLFKLLKRTDIEQEFRTITAYFLLECFAGIRHSDWKLYNLEKIHGKAELYLRTTKTGVNIRLPVDLMPSLKKVLDYIRKNKLSYNRSLQHSNRMFRLIMPLAGISKAVTTHTGRRTCATLLLSKGLSRETVSAILGVSIRIVDTYAKFTSNKIRNELERIGGI